MSKAASASKLAELHELLAEVLIDDLKQSKAENIPLPAANLGVIRQFLKDNEITASIDADDMRNLRDEFSAELAAKRTARREEVTNALQSTDYDYILQ
jgi:hypothetical protein